MNWFTVGFVAATFLLFGNAARGQEVTDTVARDSEKRNLASFVKSGEFDFHVRSVYMQTINKGDLTDYSTWALGAGMGYYSPSFKGFHVGFSGFFVFQMYAQNLQLADPLTGNLNRYEILLYDMNDFENTKDLDRLEDLYLSYLNGDISFTFGRQKITTPLLNEQDNRMRPNIFSGLTLRYSPGNWKYTLAWFDHVTMRGTVDWYGVGESFGVYPFGRNVWGEASEYKGNIESKGIGLLGISNSSEKLGRLKLWSYFAENVFGLQFAQWDKTLPRGKLNLDLGLQGFYQTALEAGGNGDPAKAYMLPGERSHGFGMKLGISDRQQGVSVNVLRIAASGRFLFPREWGREQFYASLPRERFEGNGGLTAVALKYDWFPEDKPFRGNLGLSRVAAPETNDYRMNKYGVPSYFHVSAGLDFPLKGYLEGMDVKFLLVNKTATAPERVAEASRINRVDLWNLNVILDYRF